MVLQTQKILYSCAGIAFRSPCLTASPQAEGVRGRVGMQPVVQEFITEPALVQICSDSPLLRPSHLFTKKTGT